MIYAVQFRNYKALRHVDLSLERFTMLAGPNGSGKTSALEGIQDLAQLCWKDSTRVFAGDRDLISVYSRDGEGMLELQALEPKGGLRFSASFQPKPEPAQAAELAYRARTLTGYGVEYLRQDSLGGRWETFPCGDTQMRRPIPTTVYLRLDPARLVQPSYNAKTVGPDGAGLASVLATMALSDPDTFAHLQDLLRSIIPAVKRVRFRRVPVVQKESEEFQFRENKILLNSERSFVGDQVVLDMQGADDVPATMASEGTLLVLGLLTVLLGPTRPKLILIDDLDRGLHPKAQQDLVALLRAFLDRHPDAQMVSTTHSPYLLDCLAPQEIRLTALRADGSAACARLDEHPEFERWKDDMTPGKIWSQVGESWVAESKARARSKAGV